MQEQLLVEFLVEVELVELDLVLLQDVQVVELEVVETLQIQQEKVYMVVLQIQVAEQAAMVGLVVEPMQVVVLE
tara:strand:+ start:262 stop:483 length:222 start_codon:yes stop_codon:yes gene_type:complete